MRTIYQHLSNVSFYKQIIRSVICCYYFTYFITLCLLIFIKSHIFLFYLKLHRIIVKINKANMLANFNISNELQNSICPSKPSLILKILKRDTKLIEKQISKNNTFGNSDKLTQIQSNISGNLEIQLSEIEEYVNRCLMQYNNHDYFSVQQVEINNITQNNIDIQKVNVINELILQLEIEIERREYILNGWLRIARPEQLVKNENDWKVWLLMAGRGFGKTFTGANTIMQWIRNAKYKNICFISKTLDDVEKVMVNGPSGILRICSNFELAEFMPKYLKSQKLLSWKNGVNVYLHSSDANESLRGPQFDCVWIDEFAKFDNPEETLNQIMFCLRLSENAKIIITSTPRPIDIMRKLAQRKDVKVTYGSTFDNAANLPKSYLDSLNEVYSNTKIGAQEIYGRILEDSSIWSHDNILHISLNAYDQAEQLVRVIVAIDPAVTSKDESDETGIIIAGVDCNKKYYVLEDISGKYTPSQWCQLAVDAYKRYGADKIIAEVNNGGDLVESVLRAQDCDVSYKAVRASRGKLARAEPIIALYEQHKVFHCAGLELLENQMLNTVSTSKSPDRIDALVWALTELMSHEIKKEVFRIDVY
jgi:phage terminase large subunit-like protein